MKGYKTFIFNILAAILPVLQATGAADLGLTGTAASLYALGVVALNLILRAFTTTPIFKSEPGN